MNSAVRNSSARYQVVFSGRLRKGCTAEQVKRNLAKRLQLPLEKVEQLFAAGRAVLKQTASLDEAKRVVLQLAATGAIATIEQQGAATPAKKKPAAPAAKKSPPASKKPAPAPKAAASPRATASAPPASATRPFVPLRSGFLLKPLLLLGATRELLFNLLHLALILGLLGVLIFPSMGTDVLGQYLTSPLLVIAQLAVLLLAGLLLLFLLKPLVALFHLEQGGVPLGEDQEPDLYAFVEKVCERIGAPMPAEIRLLEDATIRVAYQHGPQGWMENRTVLTLGVPLIAGLNCSQLTALLARHLSPYRNKTFPRAAAIMLHGHEWLQRTVDGEDIVDRTLKRWHEETRLGDGLYRVLQLLLGPSRHMVGWRLRLSRALDRRVVHRLAADADRLALAFSGSEGFIRLVDQVNLLAFVGDNLLSNLETQWRSKGTLPGNLVQLMVMRSRQLPVYTPQKLRLLEEQQKATTGNILPSEQQRLQPLGNTAVTPGDSCLSPAAVLFHHYSKLTRTMTLRYYHHRLRLPVSPFQLQQVSGKQSLEAMQQQRLDSYFHQLYVDFLPLKLISRVRDIRALAEAKQAWALGVARCQSEYEQAKAAKAHFAKAESALVATSTREAIHLAGVWRQWGESKLNSSVMDAVHQNARDSERIHQQALHGLEQHIKAYALHLSAVLAALHHAGDKLPDAAALKQEVQLLLATLEVIENAQIQLRELKLQTLLLETLLSLRSSGRNTKLNDHIETQAEDVQHFTRAIGFALKNAPYPFADRKSDQLMKYVLQNALTEESAEGIFDRGRDTVEVLAQVQRRALVRLITIADQVEKSMGF